MSKTRKALRLSDGDSIVTAWATRESGPGWANHPLWVLVSNRTGDLRIECLQPSEQVEPMLTLRPYSVRAHNDMTAAVNCAAAKKAGRP